MPLPAEGERGFQTPLCKQGAGIARETIAMAMVAGLEKQLGPPEQKWPLVKMFCPRLVAKCPPAPSEQQRSACWKRPRTQTRTGRCVPREGGSSTPGLLGAPQPSPSTGCCLMWHPGAGAPALRVLVLPSSPCPQQRGRHPGSPGERRSRQSQAEPPPPLGPTAPSSRQLTPAPWGQRWLHAGQARCPPLCARTHTHTHTSTVPTHMCLCVCARTCVY